MAHNLLVVGLDDRLFNFPVAKNVRAATVKEWLTQKLGTNSFHLTHNGVPLRETEVIPCEQDWGTTLIRAHPILCGGKGGFGALIRAVGSRCNRSRNKDACRDLSGRRLRDVNAQKKVSKWIEDEPERKRRQREEKRKRLLKKKDPPKHFFDDQAYMEQLRNNEDEIDSALKQGLASSGKGLKRKQPDTNGASGSSDAKKPKFWMEEEDLSSGDSLSEEEEEEEEEEDSDPSQPGGQCEAGSEPEPSGSRRVDSAALNSAGSSDEAVRSKASDEEDEKAVMEQSERLSTEVMIHIPPLEKTGSEGDGGEVPSVQPAETDTLTPESEISSHTDTNQTEEGRDTSSPQEEKKEEKTLSQDTPQTPPTSNNEPLNLDDYGSAVELESVGGERLKSVLQSMGLKCGGTLQERAQRLFSTRGKSLEELDPSLFAKAGKSSRKRKNK